MLHLTTTRDLQKSFDAVKERNHVLQELGFIQPQQSIEAESIDGEIVKIKMHDGSELLVKKIDEKAHDVTDRKAAINLILNEDGELNTGMLFIDENRKTFSDGLGKLTEPLHLAKGATMNQDLLNRLLEEFV